MLKKRKVIEEADQPSKKKRRYDNLMNWGEDDGKVEDGPDGGIRDWLRGGEETEINRTDGSTEPEPKKRRQLEIEFVK